LIVSNIRNRNSLWFFFQYDDLHKKNERTLTAPNQPQINKKCFGITVAVNNGGKDAVK
jgi:hypothetical protein